MKTKAKELLDQLYPNEIKISKVDKLHLLRHFNELRRTLDNIQETNDLWLSDVANLQKLHCAMHQILKFTSDDGEYWKNWILEEDKIVDKKNKD